jgi:hypothetical protein
LYRDRADPSHSDAGGLVVLAFGSAVAVAGILAIASVVVVVVVVPVVPLVAAVAAVVAVEVRLVVVAGGEAATNDSVTPRR